MPDRSRRLWLLRSALACSGAGALAPLRAAPSPAPGTASAIAPEEVRQVWPAARLRGEGGLSFLGFRICDVRLWSEQALTPEGYTAAEFALEIRYHRSLSGARIADRSIDEMERAGPIAAEQRERWRAAMRRLFPDVADGDRITGLRVSADAARFAWNGRVTGEIAEPGFAARFFGIWLSPHTSEPDLRARLLGLAS